MRGAKRLMAILAAVAGMAALVFAAGEVLRAPANPEAPPYQERGVLEYARQSEARFRPLPAALDAQMAPAPGAQVRSLQTYYARRAYPGAPPLVPHDIDAEMERTQRCNVCHEKGGFAPKFNAYTPLTPHPHYANCLQCHAPVRREIPSVASQWQSVRPPPIHRPALPGNPPPVPHSLQLRENCLACHAGPAAVPEVRTSHPERLHCLQCHVPRQTEVLFRRDGDTP